MLNTLKARLAVFLVFAVAVTSGVAAGIEHIIHERRLREEAVERYELLTDQTLEVIHQGMRRGGRETVDAVLEAMGKHHGLHSLRVVDENGLVHFSSHPQEINSLLTEFHAKGLRPGLPLVAVHQQGERTFATVTEPIAPGGRCADCHTGSRPPGIFELTLDVTHAQEKLAAGWWSLITSLGIAQLGLFLVLWQLSKGLFVEPVRRLVASMRRVADGDLDERVHLDAPREFEGLVLQYNEMLDELAQARRKLDAYYQDNLARADRLATVGEMATAMAHEIQNPLSGLSGALRIIRKDPAMAHRHEVVDEMLATLQRLSNTTSDLLCYARPTDPQLEAVDVNRVTASVILLLRQQHEGPRVRLSEDLATELPEAWTDAQQLRQVLLNVCLNALQALGDEEGTVTVRTSLVSQGLSARIRMEVEDDGPGIPQEVLDKVFRPFFTTKPRGTGLGLAITRRIVERAGGCIVIRSEVGEGTTVRIDLPPAASNEEALFPVECDTREEPALAVGGD